ncbi:MAG: hypothetical protein A2X19_06055 [Bacteroidetes bacterium GWE2_39_28]|nr:MAG: hypothetical protein A2X19_06055 [Bacteroidetes bacterium GWE2_39_28]OFY12806.1 MAG: hypothetical protein A2X16_00835 [Bacteroidetes bacterium GWF2_39_10]HCT93715.1 hypothetical protein [Rikenellaceae bacterium]
MPITALCILLFFGYKGFVIKSVKFDDIIFLTKTVDGQQDNVVILPSNELLWTKTYGNHVEASLCKITGQFANHYFFGLYRLGSFPFGLRYFKNPKAVYKVDLKIIKKEGDSFPSVGTTNETRIVIYEDRGTIGSNEFRIVSLSESEKKELLRNLKIMVREM